MSPPLFKKASVFQTVVLEYKDYTVLDPLLTGQPAPVAVSPDDAFTHLWGYVLGTASQFAHLATSRNPFTQRPNSTTYPFYADVMSVPTGQRFELTLAPGQTLWGLGSIAASTTNGVWVSFNAAYQTLEEVLDMGEDSVPGGLPVRITGPRPGWRKR